MGCSPPGSSIHGILQARILEWVAIPFFRGSSQPRDWTQVSCTAGRFFTDWATSEFPERVYITVYRGTRLWLTKLISASFFPSFFSPPLFTASNNLILHVRGPRESSCLHRHVAWFRREDIWLKSTFHACWLILRRAVQELLENSAVCRVCITSTTLWAVGCLALSLCLCREQTSHQINEP